MRRATLLMATIALGVLLVAGAALAAAINGTEGDDELGGTCEGDTIHGLGGTDLINPSGPNDWCFDDSTGSFYDGNDQLYGDDGNDYSIYGGFGADVVDGGAGDDGDLGGGSLNGGPGDDHVYGRDGNDYLHGHDGNDHLYGDAGKDTINAQDGVADTVDCGRGRDTVYHDPGVDTLTKCERKRTLSSP